MSLRRRPSSARSSSSDRHPRSARIIATASRRRLAAKSSTPRSGPTLAAARATGAGRRPSRSSRRGSPGISQPYHPSTITRRWDAPPPPGDGRRASTRPEAAPMRTLWPLSRRICLPAAPGARACSRAGPLSGRGARLSWSRSRPCSRCTAAPTPTGSRTRPRCAPRSGGPPGARAPGHPPLDPRRGPRLRRFLPAGRRSSPDPGWCWTPPSRTRARRPTWPRAFAGVPPSGRAGDLRPAAVAGAMAAVLALAAGLGAAAAACARSTWPRCWRSSLRRLLPRRTRRRDRPRRPPLARLPRGALRLGGAARRARRAALRASMTG